MHVIVKSFIIYHRSESDSNNTVPILLSSFSLYGVDITIFIELEQLRVYGYGEWNWFWVCLTELYFKALVFCKSEVSAENHNLCLHCASNDVYIHPDTFFQTFFFSTCNNEPAVTETTGFSALMCSEGGRPQVWDLTRDLDVLLWAHVTSSNQEQDMNKSLSSCRYTWGNNLF